jgi:hypothetical protein
MKACSAARPLLFVSALALSATGASAQLAVSANDGKAYLDNGVAKTVPSTALPSAGLR